MVDEVRFNIPKAQHTLLPIALANKTKISENDWHAFCQENFFTNAMQRNEANPM